MFGLFVDNFVPHPHYFVQVAQSYQDAVLFNEKIVSAILIKANKKKRKLR